MSVVDQWVKIGRAPEVPPGSGRCYRVEARQIGVFHVGEQFFAIKDICPHQADSLHKGAVEGMAVICPGHGWQFDLRTGECIAVGPKGARVATYPIEVRGDDLYVLLPMRTK